MKYPDQAEPDLSLRADVPGMEERWEEALAIVQAPARSQPGSLLKLLAQVCK